MVLLGCSHGLILLPVLLSLFGPLETPGTKRASVRQLPQAPVSSFSDESSATRFMGVSFLSAESGDVDSQVSGGYLLPSKPNNTESTTFTDGNLKQTSTIPENDEDQEEDIEEVAALSSGSLDLPAPSTNDVTGSFPIGALGCLS